MMTITISGPQGCGKTRMALILGHTCPGTEGRSVAHVGADGKIDFRNEKREWRRVKKIPRDTDILIREKQELEYSQVYQTRKIWVEIKQFPVYVRLPYTIKPTKVSDDGGVVVLRRVNGKGPLRTIAYKRKIDAVNAAKSLARQLNIEFRKDKKV